MKDNFLIVFLKNLLKLFLIRTFLDHYRNVNDKFLVVYNYLSYIYDCELCQLNSI